MLKPLPAGNATSRHIISAQQQEPDTMPTVYNAIQIARNLLAQGLDVQLVAQSTGLSIEAVQALAHQVHRAL